MDPTALSGHLLIVIGWVGHPFGLLWLGVPVVVAVLVSLKGGQRYLDEDAGLVTRVLRLDLGRDRLLRATDRPPARWRGTYATPGATPGQD
jgi:hypothetical protein